MPHRRIGSSKLGHQAKKSELALPCSLARSALDASFVYGAAGLDLRDSQIAFSAEKINLSL